MTKIYVRKFNETHLIVESDDETEFEIEEYFKFFMQSAKFTPKFKAGYWDGYIRLYDPNRKTLYTGLFNSLKEFAELREYELEFSEEDFAPEYSKEYVTEWLDKQVLTDREDDIEIRDYQFNSALIAITEKRQLIQSPTSSGKSLLLYLLAKFFLEHGKRVLLMTDSSNLVDQLYTDWMNYSFKNDFDIEQVQRMYALASKTISKPIVISTWQSQHATKKKSDVSHFNESYDVILVDECHKGEAASIMNIMEQCTDISYKIGLTGSLKKTKLNRLTLEGLFGAVFTATTLRELIDRGEIAKISINMVMIDYGKDIARIIKKMGYQKQREWLLSIPERMKFVVNLAASRKGNTLVLFKSLDYGKALMALTKELFPDIPVYYIDKDVSGDRRNEIRSILENETHSITFGSGGTVATGWSVKNIHTLITSESVKSLVRILQSVGRALRKSKTKTKCTYFDICDVPVATGTKSYFRKHAEERASIYIDEQLEFKTFKIEL